MGSMKTIEELKNQTPVYLHNWSDKVDVIGDFEDIPMTGAEYCDEYCDETSMYLNIELWEMDKAKMSAALEKYDGANILFASYGTDNYSEDVFVLFEQGGKLFEVNGSHCSRYGLEGQWNPEETTIAVLAHRLVEGSLGTNSFSDNEFNDELCQFLGLT